MSLVHARPAAATLKGASRRRSRAGAFCQKWCNNWEEVLPVPPPLSPAFGGSSVEHGATCCIMRIMNNTSKNLDELLAKIRELLPTLRKQYHVRTLEVFGSFVRGEEKGNSDLDLLVTFDEIPTLFRFMALENQLSDVLGVKVDLVMKDSLKPFIGKYILEEARPI